MIKELRSNRSTNPSGNQKRCHQSTDQSNKNLQPIEHTNGAALCAAAARKINKYHETNEPTHKTQNQTKPSQTRPNQTEQRVLVKILTCGPLPKYNRVLPNIHIKVLTPIHGLNVRCELTVQYMYIDTNAWHGKSKGHFISTFRATVHERRDQLLHHLFY